jgi:hypothetical protein
MIWMTWRQFRPAGIAAGAALVALAAAVAATRPTLLSLYTSAGLPACHTACAADARNFLGSVQSSYTGKIFYAGIGIMYLVPAVVGLFWGAPLIARELDSGTFRLAWSQSVTRARWATVKLVLIGGATMLSAGLMSLLIGWWSSPLYQAANQAGPNILSFSRLSSKLFSTTGIVPLGLPAREPVLGTPVSRDRHVPTARGRSRRAVLLGRPPSTARGLGDATLRRPAAKCPVNWAVSLSISLRAWLCDPTSSMTMPSPRRIATAGFRWHGRRGGRSVRSSRPDCASRRFARLFCPSRGGTVRTRRTAIRAAAGTKGSGSPTAGG